MAQGTGLSAFAAAHPERFFDVGIAEGHAVTFAAGLSAGGMRPVVALYSTFAQRAYDHILHDVALQRLPLLLCIDRAGLNARDGATHHGVADVAMLGAIPDAHIYAPVTSQGVRRALCAAMAQDTLCVVRYPAGAPDEEIATAFYPQGEKDILPDVQIWESGSDPTLCIVTHGQIARQALRAARALAKDGVHTRILLCEQIAPYAGLAARVAPMLTGRVLFLEEELRSGGFGLNLADRLLQNTALDGKRYEIMGLNDPFLTTKQGQTPLQAAGLSAADIENTLRRLANEK